MTAYDQSGALSLVESFIKLKYFKSVATPALFAIKNQLVASKAPLGGILLAPSWFFMA